MTREERFWAKVRKTRTCWLWEGAVVRGYGQFQFSSRRTVRAHRYAYESLVGPIPEGLTLDHTCRVRNCVRPTHLEPCERGENARRGIRLTTVCRAGKHPWVEDNIIRRPSRPKTSGECRACANERRRIAA